MVGSVDIPHFELAEYVWEAICLYSFSQCEIERIPAHKA